MCIQRILIDKCQLNWEKLCFKIGLLCCKGSKEAVNGWLPEVTNLTDFAGFEGSPITDVAIRVDKGSVKYRAHVLGADWLPYVTGCNLNNYQNGFVGEGKVIDAIEIYYFTPNGMQPFRKAKYSANGYVWQYDNERRNRQDGYAGIMGVPITELRLCIE